MASLKSERTLTIIAILFLVIGGIGAAYFVYESQLPAQAAIQPNVAVISSGQSVSLTVSWVGGSLPYSVSLYSSPTSTCTASSTPATPVKTGLASPTATFSVSPTTTTYYCATVVASRISSAVSAAAEVIVRSAFTTPSLALTPAAIDSGQSVTLTATVNWAGGASPYTVTLYTGASSSCSSDTTEATVLSGSNPLSSVVGASATFSVKDPVSTSYYCAVVADSSTNSHSVTTPAEGFTVNIAPSVTITPSHPAVDSGQSATLTAVPSLGIQPYAYQWFTGTDCSAGSQVTGATSSALTTGPLTSTSQYSVSVTDGSSGSPPVSACASASVAVGSTFTGTSVVVSPPGAILDIGQSVNLIASWTSAGTTPYVAQFYTSPTSDCKSEVALGLPQKVSATHANLTVLPTSTAYYCVFVKDGAAAPENVASSSGTLVTVNPGVTPTVSLPVSAIDTGQTATVTATVTWTGGTSPYSVTLYSGTSTTCTSDTTKVAVLSPGVNPQTGVTGGSAVFKFTAPAATTQYCASVKDQATTSVTVYSVAVQFTVNGALAASISPAAPIIDNGSSITLSAVAGHGTSPFSYQWYTGSACATGNAISGQTTSSYSTGAIASTGSFSVSITDGSIGMPAAQSCAPPVTVTVNPALDPSFALSVSAIDTGQTATITATVTWTGGTSPYSVTLYSGTSTTCTSDTTKVAVLSPGVNPQTGVTGGSAVFKFTAPAVTTQYCASVKDSATVQVTAPSSVLPFTVNPAVTTPGLVLSPSSIDAGQTMTITATVTWTGGTSPYSVTLYSGTDSVCSANTVVAVLLDPNPQSGLTVATAAFSLTAPASTTVYCAVVTDSSPAPAPVASSSVQFTVNPALTATVSALPQTIDGGQPVAVTLTVVPSQGTAPYQYQWYTGPTCSGGISGQTSSSYSPGVIASTTTYSVLVKDSSQGSPAASYCAPPVTVTVISPSAPSIDSGQSVVLSVALSQGMASYSYQWYTGSSCASAIGGATSSTYKTAVLTSAATYSTKATVIGGGLPSVQVCASATVTVLPVLSATMASVAIDSGQSVSLTASPSNGVSPYSYKWYQGLVCGTQMLGYTASTYSTPTLTATTSYSVRVTDSSAGTLAVSVCAGATVTVNPAFTGTTVTLSSSVSALDSGQSQSVTLSVSWAGGTSPYSVLLSTSASAGCPSSSSTGYLQTGIAGTSTTFTVTPTSTTYYCATVTDSAYSAESAHSASVEVAVNPVLTAPVISVLNSSLPIGNSSTLSTSVSFKGGTPTYTCQWLVESPTASSFSDLGSSFSCTTSSLPTMGTGALGVTGVWEFELEVTDSASVPVSAYSNTVTVTVS